MAARTTAAVPRVACSPLALFVNTGPGFANERVRIPLPKVAGRAIDLPAVGGLSDLNADGAPDVMTPSRFGWAVHLGNPVDSSPLAVFTAGLSIVDTAVMRFT